ncbi:OmpH family outer membrane protein [Oceanicoccus sp. KOV_DT_Chl]|uniref:OmpH family outer membrane protein n=1 Tax=Oceanicoccus sp. KOV_DT_Chl TaxID=1904639 RepID=UPI001F3EC78C|nr:OmpH family outer membrane protein [Oceanicoccus sp. KOV_DT_Chl]
MNKFIKLAVMAIALCTTMAASAEGKIAVLNAQQAIINTELAQNRLKELRAESSYAANRKELESLGKSYQDTVAQLQKDAAVMSAEQKQAEAKKIQEKRVDIEFVQKKLQAAEQGLLQEVAQELSPKLQKAVTELIASEGIGLLLNQQAAMHVDSSFSITAKVTDKLNQM